MSEETRFLISIVLLLIVAPMELYVITKIINDTRNKALKEYIKNREDKKR